MQDFGAGLWHLILAQGFECGPLVQDFGRGILLQDFGCRILAAALWCRTDYWALVARLWCRILGMGFCCRALDAALRVWDFAAGLVRNAQKIQLIAVLMFPFFIC